MLKNPIKLSVWVILFSLLSACQTPGQVQDTQPSVVALNSQNPVLQLAAAAPYTVVRLKSGNQLGLSSAMTGPRYRSASGRICKPLLDSQRFPIGQLVCNKGKNSWYVQRALRLSDNTDLLDTVSVVAASDVKAIPLVNYPAAVAVKESADIQIETHDKSADLGETTDASTLMTLGKDETLWAFAIRVTGDGQNWREIAAHNGIDDVRSMNKDKSLKVPNSLIQH